MPTSPSTSRSPPTSCCAGSPSAPATRRRRPRASRSSSRSGRWRASSTTTGTAARPLEAGPHDLVLDDDERRHRLHAEAPHEVGALLLVDAIEPERAVVAAALKNLGEEPFDAPAGAGDGRIEEHQARLLRAGDSG